MKKCLIVLMLLLGIGVTAKTFSYEQVSSMPKSAEKDYYIWRFLNQKSTTKKQSIELIKDVRYASPKLKKAYKKKTGKKLAKKVKYRKPISPEAKARLKTKQNHVKSIIKSKEPFKAWLKEKNKTKIFILNNAGKSGRAKLDQTMPDKLWRELTTHASFNQSIKRINKEGHKYLKRSFLHAPAKGNKLSYKTHMLLGFNAISHKKNKLASIYFAEASRKARDRENADRAMFWNYLVTKNKSILKTLIKSYDINIYTLLARDILKLKYPETITPALPKAKLLSAKDISSPIYWAKLKKKIFSKKTNLNALAKKYKSSGSIGYYTYIKSKASREVEQYFPMPHQELLKKLPKSRQAILYAIARQESRFIPGSISTSYALGMMQIMPFLVDHLAKQRKEKIDYDDMFDPHKSLVYANEHMNYLTKWLQHPLFISYAYNAGIGYTRRMLRGKNFKSIKGFEPYLSIERLNNAQANRYGKHVLANYVIYMNKLGVPLRLIDLMATLHIPSKTDKFRK
ncbi:MAG TPA: lytic transglycosylase domain-containing protein [Sulfurovum sp.]|nr:lytic transglycosylase domain-containing protein [Sulfurovum sp.]